MNPIQVKRELTSRGYTNRNLAKKFGCTGQYVSQVIYRWTGKTSGFPGGKAYRICLGISLILGRPITETINYEVGLRINSGAHNLER